MIKKIIIITAIIFCTSTISKAQQGDWIKGFSIGAGTNFNYPGESKFTFNNSIGGYVGYYITDNIFGVINPKCEMKICDAAASFLNIPALLAFNLNVMNVGIGVQYSQFLDFFGDLNVRKPNDRLNYLSAIIDLPIMNDFTLRIGYALTPMELSMNGAYYKKNPITIEFNYGYNLGKVKSNKGRNKKR
ncbi:MAG: hypothetical protein H6Q15_811 [Bacteroidetes bacterium]|nr:hypothetical protein [Bacteroidota bacterium]